MSPLSFGKRGRLSPLATLTEWLLLSLVLAGLAATLWHFAQHSFLPQSFFNPDDVAMDWFNIASLANTPNMYRIFNSLYPPLSFMITDIFQINQCYTTSANDYHAYDGRNCDWLGLATIITVNVTLMLLGAYLILKAGGRRYIPRAIAYTISFPLLYGFERGNTIAICAVFLLLALRKETTGWLKALSIAITINLKPYMLLVVSAWIIRREWRTFEIIGFFTLGVYLVSLVYVGQGLPGDLVATLKTYDQFMKSDMLNFVRSSTSYDLILKIANSELPVHAFIPSGPLDTFLRGVRISMIGSQLLIVVALVAAWLQPEAIPTTRLIALVLLMQFIRINPTIYSMTMVLFLVFVEDSRRPGVFLALVSGYLISIPYDIPLGILGTLPLPSWLADNKVVMTPLGICLGHFVRPGLVILMGIGLAADTIYLSAKAHLRNRPILWLTPRVNGAPIAT